jgi:hypothetical protein
MNAKWTAAIAVTGLFLAAGPVAAHHSFSAEYDVNKPVMLRGQVSRIEWTNPHARMFIDVNDDKGNVTQWKLELASPKVLVMQCGWKVNSVHVGDEVSVEGFRAKDGTAWANARVFTLADGRRLSAGSSGGDVAPPR